jgi:hypothetical protein
MASAPPEKPFHQRNWSPTKHALLPEGEATGPPMLWEEQRRYVFPVSIAMKVVFFLVLLCTTNSNVFFCLDLHGTSTSTLKIVQKIYSHKVNFEILPKTIGRKYPLNQYLPKNWFPQRFNCYHMIHLWVQCLFLLCEQ